MKSQFDLGPRRPLLGGAFYLNRGADQGTPTFAGREPLPLRRIALPPHAPTAAIAAAMEAAEERAYVLGECSVIVTRDFGGEWHLSIANRSRYPTWDEVAEARYRLLPDGITMVMVLPPRDEWINIHEFCFQMLQVPNRPDLPDPAYLDRLRREADAAAAAEGWRRP